MATAPADPAPLNDAEADDILRRLLSADRTLILAVSGGVDSMALLHLAAAAVTRNASRTKLVVVTVDHGLRPEAAAEAAFVAEQARQLGLPHDTRIWSGPKPATGIAAAARAVRYDLIAAAAQEHSAAAVVTAHTRDDQAETVLMRLARGSGVDGLSAMSASTALATAHGSLHVLRPLLGVCKARLVATAVARGIPWRDDPSNANASAERVRVRAALPMLEGLGLTAAALVRSARRLDAARAALDAMTRAVLADPLQVGLSPLGAAVLDRSKWQETPGEIRVRALAALVRHVGGTIGFLSRANLEDIDAAIDDGQTRTYAHVKILVTSNSVRLQRETGRPPDPVTIARGESIVWDNRFRIELFPALTGRSGACIIRPLGPDGLKVLKDKGNVPVGLRADLLHIVPAFWSGDSLLSAPPLAALQGPQTPVDAHGGMWFSSRAELVARVGRGGIDE